MKLATGFVKITTTRYFNMPDKIDKINKIKSLITDKGIMKSKVAERSNISAFTLSKILNRKIDYVADATLDRIITYLEAVNTNEV